MRVFATTILCTLLLPALAPAAPYFSTDLEHGDSGWTFFVRNKDSGSGGLGARNCHSGAGCVSFSQAGGQDWAYFSGNLTPAVKPGEIWSWSVWARTDTVPGSAGPTIAGFDASGKTLSWALAGAAFPKRPSGWARYEARLVVPSGCVKIMPRITGWGPGHGAFDDLELTLVKAATGISPISLSNDSLRVDFDPASLGMVLHDSIAGDSVVVEPLATFAVDSLRLVGSDSAVVHAQYVLGPWPVDIGLRVVGGALRVSLHADSARKLSANMVFPGQVRTKAGQRLAMPRGTGITLPVEYPVYSWSHHFANFWEWQVSMALAGATDGKTGFVMSFDQPSDAGVAWQWKNNVRQPEAFQAPSKGVWMHDRSLLVAPLRGGGWKELATRHHARQRELGRVRTWTEKIAANPNVAKLRGAVDFWVSGSWPRMGARFFDTLRLYGMDKALIHWDRSTAAQIDSLNSRGFLTSLYTQVSGANVAGTTSLDREYPDHIALDAAGNQIKGFQVVDSSGKTLLDYRSVSVTRQLELLRSMVPADLAAKPRNARFIDVTLATNINDDYNPVYPSSRYLSMLTRIRMLGYQKDTNNLVLGSEQTRDFAHAVVDYGEGPMSIAYNADAGNDWCTPEPVEPRPDAVSFDPSRRVPLLLLSGHDGFAPTWYTGDGQSKVPARWDAKDAWNILYGTMALVQPLGRAMWDTLRPRYLRTILLVGAAHDRYGFEPMTGFQPLSDDWKIQRTTFGNGWTATANLDTVPRTWNGDTLAGNGFLAGNGTESIGRILSGGSVRNFARLADRWYVEPQATVSVLDGVRTAGGVSLVRRDDSTVQLAFVGAQASVDILPGSLPWPAPSLRAVAPGSGAPFPLADAGSGWLRLPRPEPPFAILHGSFGAFRTETISVASRHPMRIRASPEGIRLTWMQSAVGSYEVVLRRIDGTIVATDHGTGKPGENTANLPRLQGLYLATLRTVDTTESLQVVSLP